MDVWLTRQERICRDETALSERWTPPRGDVARKKRNHGDLQATGRRPRRLAQAQFGWRPSSRPQRTRRRAQSRLLLPDGALRLLEERVVRPGIADGYFWRKLHHGWLAGRLRPSWRPVLRRFRGSGRDAAAPPLLQTGYQISGGRHGKAIPRQRPDRFLPRGHARGRSRRRR